MDEKLINTARLNSYGFKLWERVKALLNTYVHQTRENMIIGKTVLFDGYVAGAPLVTLNNPGAVYTMSNDTSYFVCTHLLVQANQKVGQVTIGVNPSKQVGDVVTGVNIGAVRRLDSDNNYEVLDFVIRNGIGIVHENTDSRLDCEKAITVDVDVAWTEDVYLMIGAEGVLWGPRPSFNYGGYAMGGGTLPSVGSTIKLNTGNYVGKVIIHGDVVPLRDLTNTYRVGELKMLAYDAGETTEIGGHTWLRYNGQSVSSANYSELYSTIYPQSDETSEDDTEGAVDFNLPTNQSNVGYLYICAK